MSDISLKLNSIERDEQRLSDNTLHVATVLSFSLGNRFLLSQLNEHWLYDFGAFLSLAYRFVDKPREPLGWNPRDCVEVTKYESKSLSTIKKQEQIKCKTFEKIVQTFPKEENILLDITTYRLILNKMVDFEKRTTPIFVSNIINSGKMTLFGEFMLTCLNRSSKEESEVAKEEEEDEIKCDDQNEVHEQINTIANSTVKSPLLTNINNENDYDEEISQHSRDSSVWTEGDYDHEYESKSDDEDNNDNEEEKTKDNSKNIHDYLFLVWCKANDQQSDAITTYLYTLDCIPNHIFIPLENNAPEPQYLYAFYNKTTGKLIVYLSFLQG